MFRKCDGLYLSNMVLLINTITKIFFLGITGTWEGWVPFPQDMYYNGVNTNIEAVNGVIFQNTQIGINAQNCEIAFLSTIDVKSYSSLIIEGNIEPLETITNLRLLSSSIGQPSYTDLVEQRRITGKWNSASLNITQLVTIQLGNVIRLQSLRYRSSGNPYCYITRISLV